MLSRKECAVVCPNVLFVKNAGTFCMKARNSDPLTRF